MGEAIQLMQENGAANRASSDLERILMSMHELAQADDRDDAIRSAVRLCGIQFDAPAAAWHALPGEEASLLHASHGLNYRLQAGPRVRHGPRSHRRRVGHRRAEASIRSCDRAIQRHGPPSPRRRDSHFLLRGRSDRPVRARAPGLRDARARRRGGRVAQTR